MSLKDELLEDATILGEGGFSLDQRRAMDKLSRFQLEDPHRYVIELIAAGIRSGAQEITVRNDADDLEITWDGVHPSEGELGDLFSSIFYQGDDSHQRMLQHFAQGIYGALGLKPRWIRLQRPGLSLDLTDPLDIKQSPNSRKEGVFVHVRERFSWKVFAEAAAVFDEAYETKLIRQLCAMAPVPIVVNGKPINTGLDVPKAQPVLDTEGGKLWLHRGNRRSSVKEGVYLLRDGIFVQSIPLSSAELQLVGWISASSLKLNASRSAVVEDEHYLSLLDRLNTAFTDLLVQHLEHDPEDGTLEPAVMAMLKEHPRRADRFKDYPLFIDVLERPWSLAQLRNSPGIWYTHDPKLVQPEVTHPLLLSAVGLRKRGHHALDDKHIRQWPVLQAVMPEKMLSATTQLQAIQDGKDRRKALARQKKTLQFGTEALLTRVVDHAGMKGEIAILRKSTGKTGIAVEMWVDGLPVEVITVPHHTAMQARVTSDAFKADFAFQKINHGPQRMAVKDVVQMAAEALLAEAVETIPEHPHVRESARRWIHKLSRESGPDRDAWLKVMPPVLVDLPLYAMLSGTQRSLRQLAGQALPFYANRDEVSHAELLPWVRRLPRERLERTLLSDSQTTAVMRRLLGHQLLNETNEILSAARVLRIRQQPPVEPDLALVVDHRRPIQEGGLKGVLGLSASQRLAKVNIIHQGVPLGTYTLSDGLPGLVASVSWDDARPSKDWSALDDDTQLNELQALLKPTLVALVRTAMVKQSATGDLPAWLAQALQRPLDPSLRTIPWFTSLDEARHSVQDLRKQSKVRYVHTQPPKLFPGMGSVLLLSPKGKEILSACIGSKKVQDASRWVREMTQSWTRFFERPLHPRGFGAGASYALTESFTEGDLSGVVGIRIDASRTPLTRIRCLLLDRILDTIFMPHFLVLDAVVWGSAIKGNTKGDGLKSQALKKRISTVVGAIVDRLTVQLSRNEAAHTFAQLAFLDQILRRQQIPGVSPDEQVALGERLQARPVFQLLSGASVSLNELTATHKERRLYLVSMDEKRSSTSDDRVWLPADESVRRIIRAKLGKRVPKGDEILDAWHRAARRRELLPTVPAVPEEQTDASWCVAAEASTYWIGLRRMQQRALRTEWRVDERILQSEQEGFPVPLLVRVSDPGLRADDAFEKLIQNAALGLAEHKVRNMVPTFILQLAKICCGEPAPEAGPVVIDVEKSRWEVMRWAAAQKTLDTVWQDIRLVPCSDGSMVGPVQLKAAAKKGAIRVVRPGVNGRPIDPSRPVVQCLDRNRITISQFGHCEDYTQQLQKEEAAHRRRDLPGKKRLPPRQDAVVLTVDAPAGREGYLQVMQDGKNSVQIGEHWREIGAISPGGVIPLVGFVSDDRLSYNLLKEKPVQDAHYRALVSEVTTLSQRLLGQVLPLLAPETHRVLILKIASRAFSSRKMLMKATKELGQLVDLPVLQTGDGTPISLRDVAELPGDIRWVPQHTDAPSLNKARPFVRISPEERGLLVKLLPGQVMTEQANREREILLRRSRNSLPFELSTGDYVQKQAVKHGRISAKLGLRSDLQGSGTLEVRCTGVPVVTLTPDAIGLFGVVEVPENIVSESWTKVRLPSRLMGQIRNAHREMFSTALPQLRKRPEVLTRLAVALESGGGRGDLIKNAAFIETSNGWVSPRKLQKQKSFLIGQETREPRLLAITAKPPLTVINTPQTMKVIEVMGLTERALLETQWRENQVLAEEHQKRLSAHHRITVTRDKVGQYVHALGRDLPLPSGFKKAVREASLGDCPLLAEAAEGDERAIILTAAWAMAPLLPPETVASLMAKVAALLMEQRALRG